MTKTSKAKVHIAIWAGAILIVTAVGLIYLPRENQALGFWETLYFTFRLFIFEHDLPAFPESWPLICIYFLAPLITISAVGTVVSYLLRRTPALIPRWMSDHVVICGVGRTGKLFATALIEKGVKVVGVDIKPPEDFEEWREQHKFPMIFGDFDSRAILEKAGASKARSIIFTSGNDLANLEGALNTYEWLQTDEGAVRLIWAQIANDQLAEAARAAIRTSGKIGIRIYDTYRIAAVRVVADYFDREIRKDINQADILGFGKFGRDLLDVLVNDLHEDENLNINVIDKTDLDSEVRAMAEDLDVSEMITFKRADIQDLSLAERTGNAFFICTDDDLGSLTTAMSLSRDTCVMHIYVRMTHWPLSGISENLGEVCGVFFINIKELVMQGILDLPGIFEPAQASDLKRTKLTSSSPQQQLAL
jgi:Trk K+ transport system NAD-binding subunit